jgi:hypothetical protein
MAYNNHTRYATGINNGQPRDGFRQINTHMPKAMFDKIKKEAIARDCTLGEVIRELIEYGLD